MFANFSYNVSPNADDPNGGGSGSGSGGSSNMPIGVVVPFAGSTAPADWLLCNGAQARRDLYPDLYNLIGFSYGISPATTTATNYFSTYGYSANTITISLTGTANLFITAGTIISPTNFSAFTGENLNGTLILVSSAPAINGGGNLVGTFIQPIAGTGGGNGNGLFSADRVSIPLPDLRLSTPVGAQAGTIELGSSGGSATTTITADNLPQHNHGIENGLAYSASGLGNGSSSNFIRTEFVINRTLASQTFLNDNSTLATNSAISTRNPYVGMNYIIHAKN